MAIMRVNIKSSDEWIAWASASKGTITESTIQTD